MVDLQRHEKFYELFKQNGWNGLLNVHGTPVNLPDFVKQCPNWNTDVDNIQNIVNFNTFVETYATLFARWASNQKFNTQTTENNKLWFKGIIGEYFYIENIEYLMTQIWSNDGQNYRFDHPVPASFYRLTKETRLEFGEDYGVDVVGINRNNEVVVGQIKNWNIFSDSVISYSEVVSNMFCDGVIRGWITPSQNESMFVFWLGKIKNIAKPLKDLYCPMYNKVQYFGYDDLNIIHQGDPQFFANHNHFKMSLKNIVNYNNYCEQDILNNIVNL